MKQQTLARPLDGWTFNETREAITRLGKYSVNWTAVDGWDNYYLETGEESMGDAEASREMLIGILPSTSEEDRRMTARMILFAAHLARRETCASLAAQCMGARWEMGS